MFPIDSTWNSSFSSSILAGSVSKGSLAGMMTSLALPPSGPPLAAAWLAFGLHGFVLPSFGGFPVGWAFLVDQSTARSFAR